MRKLLLPLSFLALHFYSVGTLAQAFETESLNAATLPITTESEESLITELTIYFLIAGTYTLYWLKQRA
jgi:hypothetical protein